MTPQAVAHPVSLSMGFPRQEYWSGLLFPTSRDLSKPGVDLAPLASSALTGRSFTTEPPGKARQLLEVVFWSLFTYLESFSEFQWENKEKKIIFLRQQ